MERKMGEEELWEGGGQRQGRGVYRIRDRIPDRIPGRIPDRIRILDRIPGRIPDRTADRIPDRTGTTAAYWKEEELWEGGEQRQGRGGRSEHGGREGRREEQGGLGEGSFCDPHMSTRNH